MREVRKSEIKRDAIELRVLNQTKEWKHFYIPYEVTEQKNIKFLELFKMEE